MFLRKEKQDCDQSRVHVRFQFRVVFAFRQGGSNSFSKEVNHNRIAPASPEQKLSAPSDTNTNQVDVRTVTYGPMDVPILNHRTENNKYLNGDANGFHETSPDRGNKLAKGKRHRFCCFGMVS